MKKRVFIDIRGEVGTGKSLFAYLIERSLSFSGINVENLDDDREGTINMFWNESNVRKAFKSLGKNITIVIRTKQIRRLSK